MRAWKSISPDPENPAVTNWRLDHIRKGWLGTLESLQEFLEATSLKIGQVSHVIDVGYANHSPQTGSIAGHRTHDLLRAAFRSVKVIGVDPIHVEPCEGCVHVTSIGDALSLLRADTVDRVAIMAMNVIEHVDSPTSFLEQLAQVLVEFPGSRLILSTPNPSWVAHLYSWGNNTNLGINVDHVALFGPSELIELGERCGLTLGGWGYFGSRDMPRSFRPGPGVQRLFWHFFYKFARAKNLSFAHNQIYIWFQSSE